jgi:hypothetical protein
MQDLIEQIKASPSQSGVITRYQIEVFYTATGPACLYHPAEDKIEAAGMDTARYDIEDLEDALWVLDNKIVRDDDIAHARIIAYNDFIELDENGEAIITYHDSELITNYHRVDRA